MAPHRRPIVEDEPAASTSAGPAEFRRLAARLKTVAAPDRLFVLLHLLEGERSVGELHGGLAVSKGAVAQQLALLGLGGLVTARGRGRRKVYRLTDAGRGLMPAVSALGRIDGPGERPDPPSSPAVEPPRPRRARPRGGGEGQQDQEDGRCHLRIGSPGRVGPASRGRRCVPGGIGGPSAVGRARVGGK
jgi:ArsR family transcriptional regulator, virulence genes transcriptional regulator